jgi:hypothetical protein
LEIRVLPPDVFFNSLTKIAYLVRDSLKANDLDDDVKVILENMGKLLKDNKGIFGLLMDKTWGVSGYFFAYIEKKEIVLWQCYSQHGGYEVHRNVFDSLKEFAKEHNASKISMFIKGEHYNGVLRLLKDLKPTIKTVKAEVKINV